MFRLLLLSLSVGQQSVSATVTAVSEPTVSAVVSVTAITRLQLRRHFRLRPKPEKLVSVGLYTTVAIFTTSGPDLWTESVDRHWCLPPAETKLAVMTWSMFPICSKCTSKGIKASSAGSAYRALSLLFSSNLCTVLPQRFFNVWRHLNHTHIYITLHYITSVQIKIAISKAVLLAIDLPMR